MILSPLNMRDDSLTNLQFVKWISFYKICMFITFDLRIMSIHLKIICLKQNPICLVATFIFLGVILTNKNHTVARFRRTQPLTGINKHRPLYFTIHPDPIYSSCTTSLIIYISLILKSMICFLESKQIISCDILFFITE